MTTLRADSKNRPHGPSEGRTPQDEARKAQDREDLARARASEPNDVVELYNLPFTD